MAISTIGASALDSGVSQLGKNLIINGESSVNQRGTQTGLGAAGAYLNDRWKYETNTGTGRFTASKGTGITGAAGSQRIEVTTADTSLAAGDLYLVTQKIEAQNLQHLLYGTASAKSLTYQAVFKTDVAGDYTLKFLAPDGSRTYVTTITLVGDGSQEAFTFTLPGDTSGTINNDTGVGLEVMLTLAAGSTFQGGTEDAWTAEANNTYAAANTVNFFATVGNYIEFSLCQLEVGSVATDFEHEDYGTTLAKCLRYYWRSTEENTNAISIGSGEWISTTQALVHIDFPVAMRINNSAVLSVSAVNDFKIRQGASLVDTTAVSGNLGGSYYGAEVSFTVASGSTVGQGTSVRSDGTAGGWIAFSAEL